MESTTASCCATPNKSQSSRLPAWANCNRLMMAGGVVLLGGAYFNWGWLTAIGAAPVLLAVAPCGIMCALGHCAMGMKNTPAAPAAHSDKPVN
ncbi:MAG TPA: hypothetical protein PLI43_15745 [Albidovulum sp.]|uniref:hypothetical protein n=1 Tax=Albidovulum sp. TaxID=1872424 RepID=UPI002C2E7BE6|nr:hypothetical protein [Albidovulum sp.]